MNGIKMLLKPADRRALALLVSGNADAPGASALVDEFARKAHRVISERNGSLDVRELPTILRGAFPQVADILSREILTVDVDATITEPAARSTMTLADIAGILPATQWLWVKRVAKGYLSLLVGESGVGKSQVALSIARTVLLGLPTWPDGSLYGQDPAPVIWIDTEASQALLLERALKWNLPLERILLPSIDPTNPLGDFSIDAPEGRAELERLVKEHRPPLVILDALRGSHKRDENTSEMSDLMKYLAELARDNQMAVCALHHLTKPNRLEKLDVVTIDRVRGSTAIVAMARTVLAIDRPDPNAPQRLRLNCIKSNLATLPDPLGFEIGDTSLTFTDQAPEVPRTETQLDRACDLLQTLLEREPQPATRIFEQARDAGLSANTTRRAKDKLLIVARKIGGNWFWGLPSLHLNGLWPQGARDE